MLAETLAIREELLRVAKIGSYINYSDVAPLAGLDMDLPHDRNEIADILDGISQAEHDAGRPLLSAVVIRRDKNKPGRGFFVLARRLGLYRGGDDLGLLVSRVETSSRPLGRGLMDLSSDSQQTNLALQGIRVLDFTWIHAGPSATRILSDQGAEVIKVESNNALSVIGGPASATARGLGQRHNWNAGKLSISLNMKTPQAIDIAKRLMSVSDVVAENIQRTGDAVVGPRLRLHQSRQPQRHHAQYVRVWPHRAVAGSGQLRPDAASLVGIHAVDRVPGQRPQRAGQRVQRRRGRHGRSASGDARPAAPGPEPDAGNGWTFRSLNPCPLCWKRWYWT